VGWHHWLAYIAEKMKKAKLRWYRHLIIKDEWEQVRVIME
jgi:hypothetical protein